MANVGLGEPRVDKTVIEGEGVVNKGRTCAAPHEIGAIELGKFSRNPLSISKDASDDINLRSKIRSHVVGNRDLEQVVFSLKVENTV